MQIRDILCDSGSGFIKGTCADHFWLLTPNWDFDIIIKRKPILYIFAILSKNDDMFQTIWKEKYNILPLTLWRIMPPLFCICTFRDMKSWTCVVLTVLSSTCWLLIKYICQMSPTYQSDSPLSYIAIELFSLLHKYRACEHRNMAL